MIPLTASASYLSEAKTLCQQFDFTYCQNPEQNAFFLQLNEDGLALHHGKQAIRVDFLDTAFQKRLQQTGKKSPLFKAIGNDATRTIIDTTGGLGRDMFLLAHRGHSVTVIEQSPVLFALLLDGLARAKSRYPETCARIQAIHGDSIALLKTLPQADVIYCDPMFPERKKSALVKKEMQLLQQLLGHTEDPMPLLKAAKELAKKRVVLKRPKLAPVLLSPDIQFSSKTMRFEVYTHLEA